MKVIVDEKNGTYSISGKIEEAVSKSGNSILIASSHGTLSTDATYKGKSVRANVNLSISKG